jgi:hypothetical protein
MMQYVQEGWKTTKKHTPLVLFLFIYQLVWGLFLYRFIKSIVVPLLHRFPGNELSGSAVQLFLAEGQFQVMKTDLVYSYAWILLLFLIARMMLTPLINAGIYYSIQYPEEQGRFIKGIRRKGKPFLILYWLQTAIILSPLVWLIPKAKQIAAHHYDYESILIALWPYAAGFATFGSLVYLCFMYVQFGVTAGFTCLGSTMVAVRYIIKIVAVSLILFMAAVFVAMLTVTMSMVWAGLAALIIHQLYHLIRTVFKVWEICAQHRLWMDVA